jgi:hypothetical protein
MYLSLVTILVNENDDAYCIDNVLIDNEFLQKNQAFLAIKKSKNLSDF